MISSKLIESKSLRKRSQLLEMQISSPKFYFSMTENRTLSYADFYENFAMTNNTEANKSLEKDSNSNDYKNVISNLIYRLDNFGDLCLPTKICHHNKKQKLDPESQSNSETNTSGLEKIENGNYDLRDDFIDDTDNRTSLQNDESIYAQAIKDGYYIENLEVIHSVPSQSSQSDVKRKRIGFGTKSVEIYENLTKLKEIYNSKQTSKTSIPKEAYVILVSIGETILTDENLNAIEVYAQTSKILKLNVTSTQKAIEKLIKQKEQEKHTKDFNENFKLLKEQVSKASKNEKFRINEEIKDKFSALLDKLEKLVKFKNLFADKFQKKSKKLKYCDEEAKIISALNNLCGNKVDFKDHSFKPTIKQIGYGSVNLPGRYSLGNQYFSHHENIKIEDFVSQ